MAIVLLVHLLTGLALLLGTGGTRAVLAENIVLKQQLLVLQRSRRRAPNLRTADRFLFGLCSQFLSPRRLIRTAIILKPATLLRFHHGFKDFKYRCLYSSSLKKKPGPKGPSPELIRAICELKRLNPRFGCPKIAQHLAKIFGIDLEQKLEPLKTYCNEFRVHQSLEGATPEGKSGGPTGRPANFEHYEWQSHCHGSFELPIAA